MKQSLTAVGTFSDNTQQELTHLVTWAATDPTVAIFQALDPPGTVTALKVGASSLTAGFTSIQGEALLTVTGAVLQSITVSPGETLSASVPVGESIQLVATGLFSGGETRDITSEATWSSALSTIATVGNLTDTKGIVTGQAAGTATISAIRNGITGTLDVTVTAPATVPANSN
jgi:hypothetical protein